jgi:hypothetical protein
VQTTRVNNDYRIIVELPGVTDVNQAIRMIGETPILEFKEESNEPLRALTVAEQKEMDSFNAAATKKAKDALKAVTGGMDFAEAAAKFSEDDTTKTSGGDLGFIDEKFVSKMAEGVDIGDHLTLPCKIQQTGKNRFSIILTEGKNRQIRRMCEAFGYTVKHLKRVRVMNIHLGSLAEGKWRELTKIEFEALSKQLK